MMDKTEIDILWVLVAAALVLIMQGGFLCLESGLTRTKNAINVAMKNVVDLTLAVVLFWLVGFGLMFGDDLGGWIGSSGFVADISGADPWLAAFFVFQTMFCATAATIVAGAVAERTRFDAYIRITVLVTGFIYPVFGHWAWGGAHAAVTAGWVHAVSSISLVRRSCTASVVGWRWRPCCWWGRVSGASRPASPRPSSHRTCRCACSACSCSSSAGSVSTAAAHWR